MKLSEFKNYLQEIQTISFILPNGTRVPAHFHITEIGQVTKHYIDCGGTERNEQFVSFQLWVATDLDHRLTTEKLLTIISQSEAILKIEDAEIEAEYQSETIGKYGLDFDGFNFRLLTKQTACLAPDQCGVTVPKQKVKLSELPVMGGNTCKPGGGCC
jgi:Family of unknown function (DUF6428)